MPVVRVTRQEERLGGAANVALNIKSLGAQATLITVVGEDEPAQRLQQLLQEPGDRGAARPRRQAAHQRQAARHRTGAAAAAGGFRRSAGP